MWNRCYSVDWSFKLHIATQYIWCAATRYVTDIRIIRSDPNARISFTIRHPDPAKSPPHPRPSYPPPSLQHGELGQQQQQQGVRFWWRHQPHLHPPQLGGGFSSGFRPARNASITGVGTFSGSIAFKAAMVAFVDWSSISSSLARAVACLSRNSSSQVNSSNLSESTARPAPSRNEAASKEDWVGAGPRDRSPLASAGRATALRGVGAAAAEAVA